MFGEGQPVGSYQIVATLGHGGMATVYKAYHPKLDRYVALKVIHQLFLNDPNFVARFEREAQIIARLEHPNIVPVHDFAEHEGQPFLVMKYIAGITLGDALTDGPLELRDIMLMMPHVAAALDYAHAQHVLHRDLKPSNIMLDQDGTPYLTDFGLARTIEAGESTLSHGLLIGTPAYMSPEQGEGIRELDFRSDLYSLGVVLYELVVGKVPFDTGTTYTILHDHLVTPPPPPSSINPDVPHAVDEVLVKALAKDPADRYDSATAMVAALRAAFVQSEVRRINPGQRHTVAHSLHQSREGHTPAVRLQHSSPANQTPVEVHVRQTAATTADSPQSSGHIALPVALPVALGTLAVIALVAVALAALTIQSQRGTVAAADDPPTTLPTVIARLTPESTSRALLTNPTLRPNPQTSPSVNGPHADYKLPPLPPGQPYDVPVLPLDEAQERLRQQPNDPTAYLALALAQMQANAALPVIRQTLSAGQAHGNRASFAVSVLVMLENGTTNTRYLFPIYDQLLISNAREGIYWGIRNRAGGYLYSLMTQPESIERFSAAELEAQVDSSSDPLLPAMLARLYVTGQQFDRAQQALLKAGNETVEARLVSGDLLLAQGKPEQARQAWGEVLAMEAYIDWATRQAREAIEDLP